MPRGDDIPQQAVWFRLVRATVGTRVVAIVGLCSVTIALALASWLVFTPRLTRDRWLLESMLELLRTTPPTDAILAQLPAERLASVHQRGSELISRLATPMLIGAVIAAVLVALGYARLARHLRARWRAVSVPRTGVGLLADTSPVAFIAIAGLAIAAHMPYALQSIRFDEDVTSVNANTGWFGWANNLMGWNNHVAASLTIRLFTAVFGLNELSVRMPAVIASSLSLAMLCTFFQRRYSKWFGWLCAASFMAMPFWAEQTALARGYGLSFSAAALMLIGLMRLYDEADSASSASMACLFASVLLGCLSHFFFVFLAAGLFLTLCFTRRLSAGVRSAACWGLVLAGVIPAASFAVGLPGTIAVLRQAGSTPAADVVERFTYELSFRHAGALGAALVCLCIALAVVSSICLPRAARWAYFTLMSVTLLLPLLGNPAYLYPRYFMHASVFVVPCIAWYLSTRVLRDHALPNIAACGALVALHVSTQPWQLPEFVDLRGASRWARQELSAHGEHFASDTFLSSGLRFYNGQTGPIVNTMHPIPAPLERLLLSVDEAQIAARVPVGFEIEQRLPGIEQEILLLRRTRKELGAAPERTPRQTSDAVVGVTVATQSAAD